ncbi:hypothetical protein [Alistipes onderdonkii]|nr:hypothetical protein [Alistipes onderdonkii]
MKIVLGEAKEEYDTDVQMAVTRHCEHFIREIEQHIHNFFD